MLELNDQVLLGRWYRHRNAEAFHAVVMRHGRMVYATALRVVRNAQDAEDVLQESFLALAQAKRPPSRNVAAWLHRTAYRGALKVIRSRARRGTRDGEFARTFPDSTQAGWDDVSGLIDELVTGLPEDLREPLVRHFFAQESHADIAVTLGISRQTVSHRIGRAVEAVRKGLRSKGVCAPLGAALIALIQENSATALPRGAAAALGKIPLAAAPSAWAVAGAYVGGATLKVAAVAVVAGAVIAAAAVWRDAGATSPGDRKPASAALAEPVVEAQPVVLRREATVAPSSAVAAPVVEAPTVEAASVSGWVTLPDGRPVEGARVVIGPPRAEMEKAIMHTDDGEIYIGSVENPIIRHSYSTETDEAGVFRVTEVAPGSYRVTVVEPGNPSKSFEEHARFELAPGEVREGLALVFGSEGDLSVSGWVRDRAGAGVPGVHVASAPVPRGAVTDAEGRFTLTYLPEGETRLHVYALPPDLGYADATIAQAGATDVHIAIKPFARVEGRAVDADRGRPVSRFTARCVPGHQIPDSQTLGFTESEEKPEGRFQLDALRAGEATVLVYAPGYRPGRAFVVLEEGETLGDVEVALEPSEGGITGVVVAEDGAPIPDAHIHIGDSPTGPHENLPGTTASGADGTFKLDVSPEDIELVSATHPDYAPGGSEAAGSMTIVLKTAATLNVFARSGGEPLAGVRVRATPLGAPGERSNRSPTRATTELDGRAIVSPIAPGANLVELNIGRERERQVLLDLAPGEFRELTVDFPAADATLMGAVQGAGGPLGEGYIILLVETETGEEIFTGALAEDGTFKIAKVAAGIGRLVVNVGNERTIVEDVMLISGEVTELAVDATMRGSVRGVLSGLEPETSYTVHVFHGALAEEEAVANSRSIAGLRLAAGIAGADANGAFEAPLQSPGSYTLVLESYPAGKYWRRTVDEVRVVEVPEGEALEVNIELPNQG